MNRWPTRQGTALGVGIMVLFAIGAVTLLHAARAEQLPVGFAGEGVRVVEWSCAGCHGFGGEGTLQAPPLVGVEGTPVAAGDRAAFARIVREGRGRMAPMELTDREIAHAYAYLRELRLLSGR